jgi:hypothetical protein
MRVTEGCERPSIAAAFVILPHSATARNVWRSRVSIDSTFTFRIDWIISFYFDINQGEEPNINI